MERGVWLVAGTFRRELRTRSDARNREGNVQTHAHSINSMLVGPIVLVWCDPQVLLQAFGVKVEHCVWRVAGNFRRERFNRDAGVSPGVWCQGGAGVGE